MTIFKDFDKKHGGNTALRYAAELACFPDLSGTAHDIENYARQYCSKIELEAYQREPVGP